MQLEVAAAAAMILKSVNLTLNEKYDINKSQYSDYFFSFFLQR